MLVPDRPASVSLLTLVRDAVSRLPNGEGTRSDIVELLRDSQYLVPDVETSALTTTVSGALDRLQNDQVYFWTQEECTRFPSNKLY